MNPSVYSPSSADFEALMQLALVQAKAAAACGEVPVGAVLARASATSIEVLSSAHNLVETTSDASAHAEILALRGSGEKLGNWRLSDCILVVTLEPCTMCAGAIKLARLGTLVFAAPDPRLGAVGSLYNVAEDSRSGPCPRIITGLFREESLALLSDFFSKQRQRSQTS